MRTVTHFVSKDPGPYSMSGKWMRVPAPFDGDPYSCIGCGFEHSQNFASNGCDQRRCQFVVGKTDSGENVYRDYILIHPSRLEAYKLTMVKFKLTEDPREWGSFNPR